MTRSLHSRARFWALEKLRRDWTHFGAQDPLWAALTADGKRDNWTVDEFFQSGRLEIEKVLERADAYGLDVTRRRALDFGCGAGRLTQALALHFEEVDGVDISSSMIEWARKFNKYPDRCRYVLNQAEDLKCFADGSFSFIYTVLVLQHMPPELSLGYIGEFVRLLEPSGLLVFQVPSHRAKSEPPPDAPRTASKGPLPEQALRARITPLQQVVEGQAGSSVTLMVDVENLGDRVWPALARPEGTLQIQLGNHWLLDSETVYMWDDGRCPLPFDLAPGQRAVLNLGVRLPEESGEYLLELDMVQEDRGWFEASGSGTASLCVRVESGRQRDPSRPVTKKAAGPPPERLPLLVRIGRRFPALRDALKASGVLKLYWAGRRAREWLRLRWYQLLFRVRGRPKRTGPVMEMHCVLRAEVIDLLEELGGRVIDTNGELEPGGFYRYTYWVVKD